MVPTAHQVNIVVVLMRNNVPQHVLDNRVTQMVIVPLDNVVIMTRNVKQEIAIVKVDVVGVLHSPLPHLFLLSSFYVCSTAVVVRM
jgi:hypothetical protein